MKEKASNKKEKAINKKTAKELCYMAIAVAIMMICSWLSLPIMGIPITLQTLALCLVAGLLGAKRGTIAVGAYVLLGMVGVPVFAGFTGGVAKLVSPTGGYIIGFLLATPIIGRAADTFLKNHSIKSVVALAVSMVIGLLVCYALGVVWFVFSSSPTNILAGIWSGVLLCVLPYLPFDFVKIAIAVFMIYRLKRFVKL